MEKNKHIEKILELLYSGEPANDLLAFELVKQIPNTDEFIIPLICVSILNRNRNLKKDIYDYLRVNSPTLEKFIRKYEDQFTKTVLAKYFYLDQYNWLSKGFSDIQILEFAYFNYRRTQNHKWLFCFLGIDKGTHPKRRWMFESFISYNLKSFERPKVLYLVGLFFDEIKELGEKINITYGKIGLVLHLYIIGLQSKEIPTIFHSFSCHKVSVFGGRQKELLTFPSYIFKFKSITTLHLQISNHLVFPENIGQSIPVKSLKLKGGYGIVFENFDFLKLFSGIRNLALQEYLSIKNSDILLTHKNVLIDLHKALEIKEELNIILPSSEISHVAHELKRLEIPLEKQKFFFHQFLHLFSYRDLSSFSNGSIEKLHELLKGKGTRLGNVVRKELNNRMMKNK